MGLPPFFIYVYSGKMLSERDAICKSQKQKTRRTKHWHAEPLFSIHLHLFSRSFISVGWSAGCWLSRCHLRIMNSVEIWQVEIKKANEWKSERIKLSSNKRKRNDCTNKNMPKEICYAICSMAHCMVVFSVSPWNTKQLNLTRCQSHICSVDRLDFSIT